MLATLAFVIPAFLAAGLLYLWYLIGPRRSREPGFKYVYVSDDGSVRELDDDEREYLETDFEPNDGDRPYIKVRYESKTPDGRLSGYLSRRQVPRAIAILPAPGTNDPRMQVAFDIIGEQN